MFRKYLMGGGMMHAAFDNAGSGGLRLPNQQGVGSSKQNAQNDAGNSQPNNGQGGHNTQDTIDPFTDFWSDTDSGEELGAGQQNGQGPGSGQQNGQQNADPAAAETASEARFNGYIKNLRLTEGINPQQIAQDLAQGKFESLQGAFDTIATKVYKQAVVDNQKIMAQRMDAAVQQAVRQAGLMGDATHAVRKMNEMLPFTKNPLYAAQAQAVLSQAFKKGHTMEKAVSLVKDFFARQTADAAKDLGMFVAPPKKPGAGNSNNRNQYNQAPPSEDNTDWVAALTG
jgi:hypothetical protein